ncbi:latrophilin Cirl isoform X5 [Tribolium madens]|uniref:latrophilin Cirl isoform X5 n=1 Tax=Tribolium madens TaxID=41895 RepID=UPI001CF74292|nr:latrophilin Cirl isoform X5 [Tribolium madens]
MAWHGKVRPGLLLLLFSFVVISEAMAKSIEVYRYETAYACEGKTLKIECKEGELIKLIRANYGRFSITICNDHGNTDWSVNCMSPKSLRVLHGRCTHYQNCSIPASTSMFGDPCPGTHKYLEAHYQCLPATTTTTTSRPSPPWLITSQPPMWSTVKPSARPPPPPPKVSATPPPRTTTVTSTTITPSSNPSPPIPPIIPSDADKEDEPETEADFVKPIPDEITTLPYTTVTPKKVTSESTYPNTYIPAPSVLPSWTKDSDSSRCSPKTFRSILWNWTKVNSTDIQPCPGGTTGFAKWRCIEVNSVPTWHPSTPDLSQCRSVWLTSLEQRIMAGRDPLVSITNDLAQVTSSKTLYGGDMMITTKIIQKMAQKMSQDIQTFPDTRQREAIVTEMLNDVVKTGSNLLDSSQHPSWRDLSYKEQMRVATSLLIGLEENAFLLADTVTRKKTVDQIVKNIMLSVRVLETKSVTTEVFPSDNKWSASNDSIELSQGALQENSDGGFIRLVFVAFDRLEEILQWQPDSSESNTNVTRMLNSKVISASLGKGRHIQLREPVRLTLRHLQTENVSNPSCVFWDYTSSAWLEEGCRVEFTNRSHTVCLCDHLTNFAILMDVHAIQLPIPHQIALKIITLVGCIISIVCLILAIITFQLFRGLKSDRTTIHCNLCICLLIAELIFLIGVDQTDNKIVCGVIAGFLQYFFLCAFIWMFFEGFQLYVMLIEVFEAEKSRVKWYYFFAYGFPLVIVLVSAAIYPQGYGTEQHCWLKTNNYFIYSFVGPVTLVLVLNLIFLAMAVVMMCRHATASVSIKNKEHSRLASTSGKEENALQTKFQAHLAWLKGAIVLVFLLGLTWTFGFLFINQESVVMAYLFALLNSLQGFFIFSFHCVQNEKVRKEYRKFIRRHSWLPKCLRCSKPGGGAGSSSGSSGLNKERRTSIYAGSNGNPSGTNSHSTDNSVLSPHGTSNISFKSYSRDSGHGGSEQEDSPRSHPIVADTRLNNAKDARRQAYISSDCNQAIVENNVQLNFPDYHRRHDTIPHPKHPPLPQSLQLHGTRKKNGNFAKSGGNHWSHHTYTEIYDGRTPRGLAPEDDPVYEEIERNEIQVSDMSDEDGKRQSDMSRQSSRSYGDHRPLIPYSPGTDRSILEAVKKEHSRYPQDVDGYRMRPNIYRGDTVRSLAAVLDGETVVCHLEPPEMYPRDPYTSRTLVLPQYSES